MATYRTIASTETDPEAPVTSELMKALADNPTATAEGASGAPVMETAWHELETITLASDAGEVTFTTDASTYRALRIIGGSKLSAGSLTFRVQIEISASWSTCLEHALTNNAIMVDAEIDNVDGDGPSGSVITTLRLADFNIVSGDWNASAFTSSASVLMGYRDAGTAPTAVRLALTSGNFDRSEGGTSFTLFGIKRTQP